MNSTFLMLNWKIRDLLSGEEGQDLVEYALLVSLIALAAITGVNSVASAVNSVFTTISTSIS